MWQYIEHARVETSTHILSVFNVKFSGCSISYQIPPKITNVHRNSVNCHVTFKHILYNLRVLHTSQK